MSGLIRGKRLVWVRDGMYINCWRAECQFGVYSAWNAGANFRWRLRSFDNRRTIHEGESDTLELAQAACQSDHDQRSIASIEVVPFEWKNGVSTVGPFSLRVWHRSALTWRWEVRIEETQLAGDVVDDTEQAAITAAEAFVRNMIFGIQKGTA